MCESSVQSVPKRPTSSRAQRRGVTNAISRRAWFLLLLVLTLLVVSWPVPGADAASWRSLVVQGQAYWNAVGTPEWPVVRPLNDSCAPALGCAALEPNHKLCRVWFAPGMSAKLSRVVAAHELGHCIRLQHRLYRGVMFPYARLNYSAEADRALCVRNPYC